MWAQSIINGDCSVFPPILFHRTPHNATKHGWGEGRIPTKFRKGKKLFKTTLSPLSLCVAHKIEAREKKEYISTSPPCVPVREYRGSAHRARRLKTRHKPTDEILFPAPPSLRDTSPIWLMPHPVRLRGTAMEEVNSKLSSPKAGQAQPNRKRFSS